jgi:hypothetical protein
VQYLSKKAMEIFILGKPERALKYFKQTMVIAPPYSKALFEIESEKMANGHLHSGHVPVQDCQCGWICPD